jgi:hypothetical protein
MAINFLIAINERLQELNAAYIVTQVTVWETPTSFATAI